MERLEKALEAQLCAGLSTEISATVEWLDHGFGGALVGVPPFGAGAV